MPSNSINMLTNLGTKELSLVRRGANNKRFALTKSEDVMPLEELLKSVLETPAEGEDNLVASLKSAGADEEAIYHIGRSMAENIDVADDYFPFISLVWKERLAHTWNPQSSFHPGIRRAWDEAGITYGIEGIREWEAGFDRVAFLRDYDAAN